MGMAKVTVVCYKCGEDLPEDVIREEGPSWHIERARPRCR